MSDQPLPPDATPLHVRVLYADTDAMGIVYHGRYFPWFEAGRGEYMRTRGYTYREMEEAGVVVAIIETHCRFHVAARYDDPIVVYTWLSEFDRVRMRFQYVIHHAENGKLLAEAETVHAFIDLEGRAIRITHYPEVWARLQTLLGTPSETKE